MDASSVLSDDLSDYDIISDPGNQSVDSSLADLENVIFNPTFIREPAPSQDARDQLNTANLSANDIQAFVRRFIEPSSASNTVSKSRSTGGNLEQKIVRVYVDGIFDVFNAGHALQLRQAKLSFPSVHLMVGVFSDELCDLHDFSPVSPHVERCEVVRSCRWVDEIISDAPWRVDEQMLRRRKIDYVVVEEGTTVDPKCDKVRLKGYDEMKRLGKIIPTRRTTGLAAPISAQSPSTPLPPSTPVPPPHIESPDDSETQPAPDFTAHIDQYGIGY